MRDIFYWQAYTNIERGKSSILGFSTDTTNRKYNLLASLPTLQTGSRTSALTGLAIENCQLSPSMIPSQQRIHLFLRLAHNSLTP